MDHELLFWMLDDAVVKENVAIGRVPREHFLFPLICRAGDIGFSLMEFVMRFKVIAHGAFGDTYLF